MPEIKLAPAPWKLKGTGYIVLYKFTKSEIQKDIFLPDKLKKNFTGGLAAMMLVDYHKSNVGPYKELLFIPGKFRYKNNKKNTISKIFVSTIESVVNGINNWAIPKEIAEISFKKHNILVSKESELILDIKFKEYKIKFPVNTAFIPFPLVQEKDGKAFYTQFKGKGWGKFIKIESLKVNTTFFPDLNNKKPLLAIKVENFKIEFPKAQIEDAE
jgi:hypothetical protein